MWVTCPHCGRLMHEKALTCGNYCKWDELVVAVSKEAQTYLAFWDAARV